VIPPLFFSNDLLQIFCYYIQKNHAKPQRIQLDYFIYANGIIYAMLKALYFKHRYANLQ